MKSFKTLYFAIICLIFSQFSQAQNPIINTQFTADPTARVFDGKLYLYPSHDILREKGMGGAMGYCMADYHVFSTDNLTDWKDHGVVLDQKEVPWADQNSHSMWAPDCVYKNGTYYFYFPVIVKDSGVTQSRRIGVATSKFPHGPFVAEKNFMVGVKGIDPCVFIDKDNQAYFYWTNKAKIYVSKLKENMLELATEPEVIKLPSNNFKEGPFVFERNGIYYLTYPFVNTKTERLVYAMGKHPMGPFEFKGLIMKESPTKCWTNHQSIVNFKNQWYLFYHHNDYSPKMHQKRSTKIDSLFFNEDGTIQEVIPTLRGVGITKADKEIHIDRYSSKSDEGVTLAYNDTLVYFKGWKLQFNKPNAWVSYNNVEVGKSTFKKLTLNAVSPNGGSFEIRLNKLDGKVIATGKLNKSDKWGSTSFRMKKYKTGTYNLYFVTKGAEQIEVDYVKFE